VVEKFQLEGGTRSCKEANGRRGEENEVSLKRQKVKNGWMRKVGEM